MSNGETVQEVSLEALQNAFKTHEALGDAGKELVHKNQFGDTAMRGDIEAEAAVLSVIRQYNLPVVVYSEEHGTVQIGDEPVLLAVLDGIDGSAWYKSERGKGRYGTLFGVYAGTDPEYNDYLFGGIMEHATKRLLYGVKGKGSFVMDITTGKVDPIHTADTTDVTKATKIHIDEYWDTNKETFLSKLQGYNVQKYNLCSSVHYANVAQGQADLALECTRKGNLEIAATYGLISEAGGVMVDTEGKSLSDRRYLVFCQDSHIPVITAATAPLATSLISHLRNS